MIEVFSTNIDTKRKADLILKKLNNAFPDSQINFDLEDCDNILRIEIADIFEATTVMELVNSYGFQIKVLPDTPTSRQTLKEINTGNAAPKTD